MSDKQPSIERRPAMEHWSDEAGARSARELLTRIFVRRWLFAICVAVPTLTAIGVSLVIPNTYAATTKLLIRYGTSEDAFLRDLIPESRPALSGMSSAELLRSLPTVLDTVRREAITEADVARKPLEVLSSAVRTILSRSHASPNANSAKNVQELQVAESFQRSISESTSDKTTRPITILDKGISSLSTTARGDDLINLTVPSFNRAKVASMANGLANAFIREYARLSAAEAARSVAFLDGLIQAAESSPLDLHVPSPRLYSEQHDNEDIYRRSPLLERLATELATREATLAQMTAMYSSQSPTVLNAKVVVDRLRESLNVLEREEGQKLALEQLRLRRYQAANTERLFTQGLVPITIVEEAITPAPRSIGPRVAFAGIAGAILGLLFGLSVTIALTAMDQRLYTSWEARRTVRLPLLSALPELERRTLESAPDGEPAQSLLQDNFIQLWSRMELFRRTGSGLSIAVASASDGEGKSSVIAGLASVLGSDPKRRVLLIDADMKCRTLSTITGTADKAGLIEVLLRRMRAAECFQQTRWQHVDILSAGSTSRRAELGFFRKAFSELVAESLLTYAYVLIDTSSTLNSNDSIMSVAAVDCVIWVTSAATTRRNLTQTALTKLAEAGIRPVGVVFNRRREYLPGFIWRNV